MLNQVSIVTTIGFNFLEPQKNSKYSGNVKGTDIQSYPVRSKKTVQVPMY